MGGLVVVQSKFFSDYEISVTVVSGYSHNPVIVSSHPGTDFYFIRRV